MEIHKSHSKNDLIDVINLFGLPVIFSHQDKSKKEYKRNSILYKELL